MLTDKQKYFFELIENYYKKNNILPNLNIIKKITKYKSYNSIYKYLKILEKYNYLKYDYHKKEIIYLKSSIKNNNIFKIPYINQTKHFLIDSSLLKNKKNYYAFLVPNNKLQIIGINKNDIVIIEESKIYLDNKIVLVKVEQGYQLYKYEKKDEIIHLINDNQVLNLISTNTIIGKVVLLIKSTI